MRQLPLFLPLLILQHLPLSAQQITELKFGDTSWNTPQKIWQMPDGNLAVVAARFNGNWHDTKLHHFSPNGQQLAEYDLPIQSGYYDFVENSADGATFLLGSFSDTNFIIRTINLHGTIIDSLVYQPQESNSGIFSVKCAPKGDVVIAFANQVPPKGVRVTRLTSQGAIVFTKYIAADDPEFSFSSLTVTPDGRTIILIMDTQADRMSCYNATGTQMWTKPLPFKPTIPGTFFMASFSNGNVALVGDNGWENGENISGYVAMYPISGPLVYKRRLDDELPNFEPVTGFIDGNQLVIAGEFREGHKFGLGVIKLDAYGQTVFAKKFDHLSGGRNFTADMTKNGDYVFSGYNWDQTGTSSNAYVLCIQPDGSLNWKMNGGESMVRKMTGFCHLRNGDMMFIGQTFEPQFPPGVVRNVLVHVSGIGTVYPYLLSGQVIIDSVANCLLDTGETGRSSWIVRAETPTSTRYATTDQDGLFSIRLEDSIANIKVQASGAVWSSCSDATTIDFNLSDTVTAIIPVKIEHFCPDLNLDATTWRLRRCLDSTYKLSWCNNGSVTAENLELEIVLDSFFNFVNASLPVTSSNGAVLHFSPDDLAGGRCGSMSLTIHSSCNAPLGTLHCLSAILSAGNACQGFKEAAARDCRNSIGSFDPNDKRVFIADTLAQGRVLANTPLKYQIRFQNSGTDTAFHVVVVDTLPGNLNVNTLRLGASSHSCVMQISGERVVKFIFKDIMLPDNKTNEPASHGFVNFHIEQQPDLSSFTKIDNFADIYFDFNQPIRTNLERLRVQDTATAPPPAPPSDDLILYPNPAPDGLLWLEILQPQLAIRGIWVYDVWGRQISSVEPEGRRTRILLPGSSGLYFIRTISTNGSESVRSVFR